MGRRKSLILFVFAAALVLIGFAVSQRPAADGAAATLDRPAPQSPSAMEPPDSGGREAVVLEVPPAATAEVPVVSDTKAAAKAEAAAIDALYREKYRAFSKDQLLVASHALNLKRESETERITKEILASADMETFVVSAGETVPPISTVDGSPVAAGVFKEEYLPDGSHVWKQRVIDAKTYPEFHALLLEVQWVDSEVIHLDRLGK